MPHNVCACAQFPSHAVLHFQPQAGARRERGNWEYSTDFIMV